MSNPKNKVTIVGGGFIGALEAYFAYLDGKEQGHQRRVTVYDMKRRLPETTPVNIVPSVALDEMGAVACGAALVEKLRLLFSEPGGIRVDDVPGVNESAVAKQFIAQAQQHSADEAGQQKRAQALLKLGKRSMELWQQLYDKADDELQQILRDSNFNPCHELQSDERILHDGYRIDLIYNVANARACAEGKQKDYVDLGYQHCSILTPAEVQGMVPALKDFCVAHSHNNDDGELVWNDDTTALFRPGGCIDTAAFMPKLYAYLKKVMGHYTNPEGIKKDCFRLKFNREVSGVHYAADDQSLIDGLHFANGTDKTNKHKYEKSNYVFCPGVAGTLNRLGFAEPPSAGFAGPSLRLKIPVPADKLATVANFNHFTEVHQEGIVLPLYAKCIGEEMCIRTAGTKAFYADQTPNIDQAFARNRHVLQLNMMNSVFPQIISMAFNRDTSGQQLTEDDLNELVARGIAERWVGVRAVAYDGFLTLGDLYIAAENYAVVSNARCTTHLGPAGVSYGPAAVVFSRTANSLDKDPLLAEVVGYARSNRGVSLGV